MHVKDARKFVASTPHRVVPGDTLVFDFVFFLHPVRVLLAGQGGWCPVLEVVSGAQVGRLASCDVVHVAGQAGALEALRGGPHLTGSAPPHRSPMLPMHPASHMAQTAIGHWSEMLFPLFSILRQERSFARPPTQFLQLHLKRCHMMEWVSAACCAWGCQPLGCCCLSSGSHVCAVACPVTAVLLPSWRSVSALGSHTCPHLAGCKWPHLLP